MTNKEKIKGFVLVDLCQGESSKKREKDTYYAGKNHTFNYDLYPVLVKDINKAKVYKTKKEAKKELNVLNKKCIHNCFRIASFKKAIKNMTNKELVAFTSMRENKACKKYSEDICNSCNNTEIDCDSFDCEKAYKNWLNENVIW
ncbi:hypothetical protein [Clostridioides sp. ES-S-0001-03]|uniref:hypothetical protein n=1 Tax=Clostridioides sp. ES-S-0001-03 TaxID=2770771 RepID=UPI001D0C4CEE|nr:hypothetical protein [Clostridioides sp. ES-S-0001-03]